MELNNILAFIALATLLVISPGPNGLLIAKTVPLSGMKAGFVNIWGFVAAFYVHGTLSVFGVSLLLVQSAQAFFVFKMLGAAYLCWIGVKALNSAFRIKAEYQNQVENAAVSPLSYNRAFSEGFFTNVLNPKVSMFYLAAFPQFISANTNPLDAYMLVTAHSLVNLIWFSLMVLMLARIKQATTNTSFRRWLHSVTGVVFVGFGVKLALMRSH